MKKIISIEKMYINRNPFKEDDKNKIPKLLHLIKKEYFIGDDGAISLDKSHSYKPKNPHL